MKLDEGNQVPWLTGVFLYDAGPLILDLNENRSSMSSLMCLGQSDPRPNAEVNQSLFIYLNSEFEVKVELSIIEVVLLLESSDQNLTLKQDHPINFIVPMESDHPGYMFHLETFSQQKHDQEAKEPCLIVTASQGSCRFFDSSHGYRESDKWLSALQSGTMQILSPTQNQAKEVFISVYISAKDVCHRTSSRDYGQRTNIRITLSNLTGYSNYVCPILTLIVVTAAVCAFACGLVRCKTPQGSNSSSSSDNHVEGNEVEDEPQSALRAKLTGKFKNSAYKSQALKRLGQSPTLSHFSYGWEKDRWMKRNRSLVYLVITPLISLFYFVPSIQFVMLAKDVESLTGSMEHCYHNYYCSKPWFFLDDFNHIVSNLPYLIYGLVFVILVRFKSASGGKDSGTGIPRQYSVFYTMGITLAVEGIFSMIYHICPTNFSLQFDTTMLYVMGFLIILKLYQFRHPDAVMTGYTFYAIIGGILILVALSLYLTSWIFFSIFLACYILVTLGLAMNAYYLGILNLDSRVPKAIAQTYFRERKENQEFCGISYKWRFFMCLLFVILNILIASFAVHQKIKRPSDSLSNVVIAILGCNVLFYMLYYMIRNTWERVGNVKRCKSCQGCFTHGQVFILLALIFGYLALYFFRDEQKSRQLTPAESRNLNEECVFLDFFDNHDIWHFFGASGLFMVFLGLLTMEDELKDIPRDQIQVF
ncbi:hypothetical protein TCAL_06992 [Tigriopus californicus]|uniref:SID1 transmembrane family member 1 n=1 Tax=Tigriopus californicus TaxID=6832 RepID=A0A553P6X9_TIGCA|nr:hypothetical protein TCAL_06992 [Tigriopus californicus]